MNSEKDEQQVEVFSCRPLETFEKVHLKTLTSVDTNVIRILALARVM